jgi:hypothetical protein
MNMKTIYVAYKQDIPEIKLNRWMRGLPVMEKLEELSTAQGSRLSANFAFTS